MAEPVKESFSKTEWQVLVEAPFDVGMVVMAADMNIPGLLDEGKALLTAVNDQEIPASVESIISEIIAEIRIGTNNVYTIPGRVDAAHPDQQESSLLDKLSKVRQVLDSKLTFNEAADFKNWLVSIAASVSQASVEGSFMGFGGEKVSDKETHSLVEIAAALGLNTSAAQP